MRDVKVTQQNLQEIAANLEHDKQAKQDAEQAAVFADPQNREVATQRSPDKES